MAGPLCAVDVGGLGVFAAIAVGVVLAFLVAVGIRNRGSNSGILEWDPEERVEWRWEQEDRDLVDMLELHNAERRRRQLEPLTLDEYRELVRSGRPT